MKHLKYIKNKLDWEKYYDPNFEWNDYTFYSRNKLSEDFIREFQDKIDWSSISIGPNSRFYFSQFKILNDPAKVLQKMHIRKYSEHFF